MRAGVQVCQRQVCQTQVNGHNVRLEPGFFVGV